MSWWVGGGGVLAMVDTTPLWWPGAELGRVRKDQVPQLGRQCLTAGPFSRSLPYLATQQLARSCSPAGVDLQRSWVLADLPLCLASAILVVKRIYGRKLIRSFPAISRDAQCLLRGLGWFCPDWPRCWVLVHILYSTVFWVPHTFLCALQ